MAFGALSPRMKFTLLTLILVLPIAVSLSVGSVSLNLSELGQVMSGNADTRLSTIVLDIRLPRSLLAVIVGAGISAAGAALQGLFRNPLADPALIGVSSGAALFVALFIVIGGSQGLGLLGMAGSAFLGGLIAAWVVLLVLSLIHISEPTRPY